MHFVPYLKRLYALDTLDTRFTVSSKTPLQQTANEHAIDALSPRNELVENSQHRRLPLASHPSKWRTPEFYFYYFCFITIVPLMFYVPYSVSKESDPEYPKFAPLLSAGWIAGRKVDNSDAQYASFRDNIPYMGIIVLLHPLLRKLYEYFYVTAERDESRSDDHTAVQGNARLKQRVQFDLIFATIFVFVLHGFSAFKVFLILYINYSMVNTLPRTYIPAVSWTFNIAMLFTNELYHGYQYSHIARLVSQRPFSLGEKLEPNWGNRLDSYGGLIPRWEILFNITVLRLISYNMDYYWSLEHRGGSAVEVSNPGISGAFTPTISPTNRSKKKQLDPSALSERDRVSIPAPPASYTFANYVSYILYSPLYLAGPILTFNDYISQVRFPSPSITISRTVLYGIRFLLALLSMEVILHFIYAVAISKSSPDWSHYTPFELSMLGYFSLHHIWLKLLLPWRFFRLWSLLDGVDPPENMVRCMSDNYSALAFWRAWHRSFNRWIIRYLYVPLGGSGENTSTIRSVANLLLVFMFVAMWHDISLRLLAWSWLIVAFLLPEIICSTILFPARNFKNRPTTYRMLCGIGAVGNILMMMAANLVGFAVGLDGLEKLAKGIVDGWQGWGFLASACASLFIGTMVMFEHREEERRKGINMKC